MAVDRILPEPIGFYTDSEGRIRPIVARSRRRKVVRGGSKVSPGQFPVEHQTVGLRRARDAHGRRSEWAQKMDELLEARITSDVEKWRKAPNRWDIRGVDYFPAPTLKGNFDANVRVLAYASEQYYNKPLPGVKVYGYSNSEEYDQSYGRADASSYAHAFARLHDNSVHFSPKATRLLTKGFIETSDDYYTFKAAAHEVGHLVGEIGNLGSALDEGSNEILADRFTLNNVPMDRELRSELRSSPPYAYWKECRLVGDIALLLNDGDPERSLTWLTRLKVAPRYTPAQMAELETLNNRSVVLSDWKAKAMEVPIKEPTGLDPRLDRLKMTKGVHGVEHHPFDVYEKEMEPIRARRRELFNEGPKQRMMGETKSQLRAEGLFPDDIFSLEARSEQRVINHTRAVDGRLKDKYPEAYELAKSGAWWVKH